MPKFLRNYKLLLKTFYIDKKKILCMLILNGIDIVLACDRGYDYDISLILQDINIILRI